MKRLYIYLAVLLFTLTGHYAQGRIVAVDAGGGLTDKYITAICKDSRGLMWIGTKQGLCTYDGNRFEPLSGALQNGNAVSKLLYDSAAAMLWVASDKGLYAINCQSRSVTSIDTKEKWTDGTVSEICLFPDGRLYVAYKSGEIAVVDKDHRLKSITRLSQQTGAHAYASYIEPSAPGLINIQISGRSVSYRLHTGNGYMERDALDSTKTSSYFRKLLGDTLLIGRSGGGLEMRDKSTFKNIAPAAIPLLASFDNIIDVHFSNPATCYVLCRPSNLFVLHLDRNRVDTISSEVFTGRLSTCFYYDADNILWLGTNKGLVKITQDRNLFTRMLYGSDPVSIRSLAEDENGNLYAGTYSGLFRKASGGSNWKKWSHMIPYAMLNMPGRYLYFVGEQPLLYRIDKQSVREETGFYKTKDLPVDQLRQAYAMISDEEGLVWIGTNYGLAIYSPVTNTLSGYKAEGLPPNTEIRNIRLGKNKHLWLCTRSGLYELDRQSGRITWHLSTLTKPALTANTVNYLDEDTSGRLWLCTDGGGIDIISANRRDITELRTEDGLSDNTTYHLLWQGASRMWISTFNGLSSYDLRSNTFYNFYVEDGITSNEFNHNAFLKAPSGRLYFGGINGLNAFFPDSVIPERKHTALFASTISKWDNKAGGLLNIYPTDSTSVITLGPLDHSLTFNLALTDYHNPENEIFLYRIKGLFDEWVSLNNQRTLRLDGLAAGDYVLEIKALDSRGVPAANTLNYHIRVAQPFYKSWWFYLLLFLFASGLLSAFFFLRLQNIKRVQHLRQQLASDLHDEVGSFLTRITMTSDNLRFSNNSEADRTSKLQKIASLSRTAASSMSDILWAIDARNDYTGNLADRMREHAEEMLAPLNLNPEFDFAVNPRMSIPSQLRQQLYLIYKEAINNIVKHSRATEVRIVYHHNEQGFKLSIVNNGYVAKERPSQGQGIKNMHMRAKKVLAGSVAERDGNQFKVIISGR